MSFRGRAASVVDYIMPYLGENICRSGRDTDRMDDARKGLIAGLLGILGSVLTILWGSGIV
jgi:hypothetical protein